VTVVVAASEVVAALVDSGVSGHAARDALRESSLAAPALLPFEVDNVCRRLEASGTLGRDVGETLRASVNEIGTVRVQRCALRSAERCCEVAVQRGTEGRGQDVAGSRGERLEADHVPRDG
jgi:predicted nucleic acid-binding protein